MQVYLWQRQVFVWLTVLLVGKAGVRLGNANLFVANSGVHLADADLSVAKAGVRLANSL